MGLGYGGVRVGVRYFHGEGRGWSWFREMVVISAVGELPEMLSEGEEEVLERKRKRKM